MQACKRDGPHQSAAAGACPGSRHHLLLRRRPWRIYPISRAATLDKEPSSLAKPPTRSVRLATRFAGREAISGPTLSELVGRDRKEVYRDIAEPSARINPEFVSYTIGLKNGQILVGTVRAEGADALRVVDTEAKVTIVPRDQIDEFRPASASVMPVGLPGVIGEQKLRDLIAFLTTKQEPR